MYFCSCSKESVYKYIIPVHNTDGSAYCFFFANTLYFSEENPSKSDTFWPYGIMSIGRSGYCCWPDQRVSGQGRNMLLFDVLELGFLDHSPPTSFTVNTSHQVGKARCLDAMQTLKKGASFFSEPWRRCFNCLFFHFFCLGYVTCHVDGVFLWFRIIIKFTLS